MDTTKWLNAIWLQIRSPGSAEELAVIQITCLSLLAFAAVSFGMLVCCRFEAYYGRYSKGGVWGPLIPAKARDCVLLESRHRTHAAHVRAVCLALQVAWILQEAPSLAWPLVLWYYADPVVFALPNKILLGAFILHYFNRYANVHLFLRATSAHHSFLDVFSTLVFPLRTAGGKPTPFTVFAMAFVFCLINGYLQGRWLTAYAKFPADWSSQPHFIIGKHQACVLT